MRVETSGRDKDVVITVTDTGTGISKEFLPFVFDRFRQADSTTTRTQSGLGLGLAIVRHLAELHGGRVSAESGGAGQGATFRVVLPKHTHIAPGGGAGTLAGERAARGRDTCRRRAAARHLCAGGGGRRGCARVRAARPARPGGDRRHRRERAERMGSRIPDPPGCRRRGHRHAGTRRLPPYPRDPHGRRSTGEGNAGHRGHGLRARHRSRESAGGRVSGSPAQANRSRRARRRDPLRRPRSADEADHREAERATPDDPAPPAILARSHPPSPRALLR